MVWEKIRKERTSTEDQDDDDVIECKVREYNHHIISNIIKGKMRKMVVGRNFSKGG